MAFVIISEAWEPNKKWQRTTYHYNSLS